MGQQMLEKQPECNGRKKSKRQKEVRPTLTVWISVWAGRYGPLRHGVLSWGLFHAVFYSLNCIFIPAVTLKQHEKGKVRVRIFSYYCNMKRHFCTDNSTSTLHISVKLFVFAYSVAGPST